MVEWNVPEWYASFLIKMAMSGNKTKFFKLYFLYLIDPRFPDNGKIEFVFGPNQDAVVPGLFIVYHFSLHVPVYFKLDSG